MALKTLTRFGLALAACLAAGCSELGKPNKKAFPVVVIRTTAGTVKAELWPDKAPITVQNFLRHVDEQFYDGTIFHRVMVGFMIQGGGMKANWQEKPTHAPIKNEADNGLRNVRGTLAMARTDVVDSATSQFYINTVDNGGLDHGVQGYGYAVFGQVTEGMEVVHKIERAPSADPKKGIPVKPVLIKSIRRAGS